MASQSENQRLSRYFSYKKEPVHSYAVNNVFHFNPRGESVWTDEEKAALSHKVNAGTSSQPDWKEVAKVIPTRTTMECYMQYMNVQDPEINNSEWTTEEDAHLLLLAEKYSEHHWINIAEELGTRRTPMSCLKRYQRTLNTKLLNNDEWSSEEDLLLKAAVESCGKGKWLELSLQIPGRSSVQCMNRWAKSALCQDNIVSGKWVEEEERLLFLAAIAYNAPSMKQTKKSEELLWNLYVQAGLEQAREPAGANISSGSRNNNNSNSEEAQSSDSENEFITSTTATAAHNITDTHLNQHTATDNVNNSAGSFPHWKNIAALIPGKTEIHCREKWFNSLDPSVNAAAYSAEEDMRLARVVYALQRMHSASSVTTTGEFPSSTSSGAADKNCVTSLLTHTDTSSGIKWARVAAYLPGRTDASVRSRWNLLLKGIAKAQPDKAIAPVTIKRRAAAHPKSAKRAKGGATEA